MKKILDKISPDEALEILKILANADEKIKSKIMELAEEIIKDIEFEDICDDVFWMLDSLDVHDLWDRSGSTVDGYTSPEEMAVEMVEEALEPFEQEVVRFFKLNLHHEANICCKGILMGLYRYEHDSKSEFKDWAADIPGECFGALLKDWGKRSNKKSDIDDMNEFLTKECANWMK